MPEYNVQIREIHVVTVTVMTENEEEARAAATALYGAALGELEATFSHLQDSKEWGVTKLELEVVPEETGA